MVGSDLAGVVVGRYHRNLGHSLNSRTPGREID